MSQSHNADGSLKGTSVSAAGAEMVANKDTDGTLAANSDTKYFSQKAVKTYVDSRPNGDVTGGVSSTDNAVVRFDGITGKVVQNSGVTIDDSNNLTTAGRIGIGTSGAPTSPLDVVGGNITIDSSRGLDARTANGAIILSAASSSILRLLNYAGTSWADNSILNGFFQLGANQGFFTGANGVKLNRFGISSAGTTISDLTYNSLPVPTGVLHVESNQASSDLLNIKGASGLTGNYMNVTSNGGSKGNIFTIKSNGSIGVNNSSPDASAVLDISSTTKGFLLPRMTTTEKNAISSPTKGLTVFDTTLNQLCTYDGSTWQGTVNMSVDTDGTLAANSDTKLASQKAVKTYIDTGLATKPTATLDTDSTLAANSDTKVASQKATKTYVDNKLSLKEDTANAGLLQPYWNKLFDGTAVTVFLGDSITWGYGVSQANAYPEWYQRIVRNKFSGQYTNWTPPAVGNSATYGDTSRNIAYGGTPYVEAAATNGSGLGSGAMTYDAAGDSNTFTTNRACTQVEVWYKKGPNQGNLKITIDGGTPVTIDTGALAVSWGNIWSQSGLTNAVHTIKVEAATGGTYNAGYMATVESFAFATNTTLPRLLNAARQGGQTIHFNQSGNPHWEDGLKVIAPTMVVINLGTNDIGVARTASAYQTNLQEIVTTLNNLPVPPVAIAIGTIPKNSSFNDSTTPKFTDYYNAVVSVVNSNANTILWDRATLMGDQTAQGYINAYGAGVHPNTAGHHLMAESLAKLLLPSYMSIYANQEMNSISSGGPITSSDNITAANNLSAVGGSFLVQNAYGFPVAFWKEGNSVGNQIAIGSGTILGALGGPASPSIMFGDGSATLGDTYLTRSSSGQLSIGSSKLTIGAPSANTDAATKKYVDDSIGAAGGLPSQTGNSGKYLTTDGTTASWASISGGSGSSAPRVVALTDGATITPDSSTTDIATVTLGGNRTMAAPSGTPIDGQKLNFRIKQDATGSRTITWNAIYRFSTDLPQPVLSTAASKTDRILFEYNAADSKWDCTALNRGY